MLLLDSNIVSFFYKKHSLMDRYFPMIVGRDTSIGFQTLAELEEGGILAKWSAVKYLQLQSFLAQYHLYHSDEDICTWWALVRAIRKSHPISTNDAWIAATALSYDIELVTHNPNDFRGILGLRVLTAAKG